MLQEHFWKADNDDDGDGRRRQVRERREGRAKSNITLTSLELWDVKKSSHYFPYNLLGFRTTYSYM
jgi:hypothetical protein